MTDTSSWPISSFVGIMSTLSKHPNRSISSSFSPLKQSKEQHYFISYWPPNLSSKAKQQNNSPYLPIKHIIRINTIHPFLVIRFTQNNLGCVLYLIFGKVESKIFIQFRARSDGSSRRLWGGEGRSAGGKEGGGCEEG